MPEIKRLGQAGKMNTDFHEKILPPGEYREALNVNVGRSETSEVGTVENLLGNAQIMFESGEAIANGVCIGSYRDNENERIFFFVTSNNSFDESNGGEHAIYMFEQLSGRIRRLVSGSQLNFHRNFPIFGVNLLEDLLFWTDDRNEPRKINIDRAIEDSNYYNTDVLMAVAKTAPFQAPTIVSVNSQTVTSTFLEDKLPRFSYRWQFEDGEYSVLAPFTPIVFRSNNTVVDQARAVATGEFSDFVNNVQSIGFTVPVTPNAGIVSVELLYKDSRSNTVYILEDKPVATEIAISFDYLSQDPFRAIPNSQVTRVSDAVPRRAKAQEVAGSRIVYGNFLQNYNLPTVDFTVGIQDANTNSNLLNHSVKTRRTYQVGIVLSDEFGRTTPVILSNTGAGTIFVGNDELSRTNNVQLNITFPNQSQIEGFHSYKVVIKQTQQEYYNWFTNNGNRFGDSVNKVPIDQTVEVEDGSSMRPSSRLVYSGDSLQSVTITTSNGVAEVDGSAVGGGNQFFEVEPVESLLNIFFETSTGGLTSGVSSGASIPIEFYNCYIGTFGSNKIEANRIRMGFNEDFFDVGVRAHAIDENFAGEERRGNALIHSSGLFNSRTGLNQLNQFNAAEGGITLSLDPSDGSIQKLYAEDTQLIIWQEDKVSRSPVDKDFIYSAEGGAVPVTSNTQYLGTIAPYAGEYGISQDPGSFAVYGTRKYFTDRNRGVVLRLSNDGLTEISQAGMSDFFRDALRTATNIIGSFDEYHNTYNLTISGNAYDRNEDTNRGTASDGYFTLGFEEDVSGWVSFKSFEQESGETLNNRYYTFNGGGLWEHNRQDVSRNNFYGNQSRSYIDYIFNDGPSEIKQFNTLGYEGLTGWACNYIETDLQTFGDVPVENANYADATLRVNSTATNTSFTGETTNIVPLTNGTGSTEWVVVVSPISLQYEIQSADDIRLRIGDQEITGDNKRLTNGNLYFRITNNNITAETPTVTVELDGQARLAFAVSLLTINIINGITNTTLSGDISREFTIENTNISEIIDVLADELYYIRSQAVAQDVSIDTSGISSFLQPGGNVTIEDLGTDDVRFTVPIRTPAVAAGVANLSLAGFATLKPLLTWAQDVSGLTPASTWEVMFTNAFNVAIPRSPREAITTRQGTYTISLDTDDITTSIFENAPALTVTNGTAAEGVGTDADGSVSFLVTSDISDSDLTTTITATASAIPATLGGPYPDLNFINSGVSTETMRANPDITFTYNGNTPATLTTPVSFIRGLGDVNPGDTLSINVEDWRPIDVSITISDLADTDGSTSIYNGEYLALDSNGFQDFFTGFDPDGSENNPVDERVFGNPTVYRRIVDAGMPTETAFYVWNRLDTQDSTQGGWHISQQNATDGEWISGFIDRSPDPATPQSDQVLLVDTWARRTGVAPGTDAQLVTPTLAPPVDRTAVVTIATQHARLTGVDDITFTVTQGNLTV